MTTTNTTTTTTTRRSLFATGKAQAVYITVGSGSGSAEPRMFSTGSYGYNASFKTTVMVDGQPTAVQVTLNMTVVGSKPDAKPSAKSLCPFANGAEFLGAATAIRVGLEESLASGGLAGTPRQFSTGSFGWNVNGKIPLQVGGKTVILQVGGNPTVIGSKTAE